MLFRRILQKEFCRKGQKSRQVLAKNNTNTVYGIQVDDPNRTVGYQYHTLIRVLKMNWMKNTTVTKSEKFLYGKPVNLFQVIKCIRTWPQDFDIFRTGKCTVNLRSLPGSVPDPWHFGTDPDPRIRTTD